MSMLDTITNFLTQPPAYSQSKALAATVRYKEGSLAMQAMSGENLDAWWSGAESASWSGASYDNFVRIAYKENSAAFACIQALATGFAEPPIAVHDADTKEIVKKPRGYTQGQGGPVGALYNLFRAPNPMMGEKDLWLYFGTYLPLGGNSFLYKARSRSGLPVQLWPYHAGKMRAVPQAGDNPQSWVDHFAYDLGQGQSRVIPVEDVIHSKWMPDPAAQWQGQAPLEPIWREILTDNELTRFIKALLQNDATPRGVLTIPAGMAMRPGAKEDAKLNWKRKFGGNNAGDIAVLEGGMTYTRVALSLQELQSDLLRRVPEARIASALKVPPIVAHLNVGLEKSTYANYEEARAQFTEETLKPLWALVESTLNHSLMPEFDPSGRYYLAFDTSQVEALKENVNDKATWVVTGYKEGILSLNQALSLVGEQTVDGPEGDLRLAVPGTPGAMAHAQTVASLTGPAVIAQSAPPPPPALAPQDDMMSADNSGMDASQEGM